MVQQLYCIFPLSEETPLPHHLVSHGRQSSLKRYGELLRPRGKGHPLSHTPVHYTLTTLFAYVLPPFKVKHPPQIWEHATLQSLHAILIFGGKQEMWGRGSYPTMHHTIDCFRGWDRRVIIPLNRYSEHSASVSQAGRKTQIVSLGQWVRAHSTSQKTLLAGKKTYVTKAGRNGGN